MKKFAFLLAIAVWFSSCDEITGNGNIRTEKRNVSDFHGVKSGGSIDVEIKSGDTYSVSVEDDDNLLPYIITEVNDGVLEVYYKSNTSINEDHAKVYVTAPSLDKIVAAGSADITASDILKSTKNIDMNVSGSGSIKGEVNAPAINISVFGSGNIDLSGRTNVFTGKISGGGDDVCAVAALDSKRGRLAVVLVNFRSRYAVGRHVRLETGDLPPSFAGGTWPASCADQLPRTVSPHPTRSVVSCRHPAERLQRPLFQQRPQGPGRKA